MCILIRRRSKIYGFKCKTMLSPDKTFLFTHIPLTETIDNIREQLLEKKIEIPISVKNKGGPVLICHEYLLYV